MDNRIIAGIPKWSVNTKSVAGSANVTLTDTEAAKKHQKFTGVLTGNIQVIVPVWALTAGHEWICENATTGSFTLTFIGPSGTGILIPQSSTVQIKSDGTNLTLAGASATGATPFRVLTGTATTDLASIADGAALTTTVTVTGAVAGDPVIGIGHTALTTEDLLVTGKVSAADTVEIVLHNKSGGAVDLASGTIRVVVAKYT
jgi:hypothetical protein